MIRVTAEDFDTWIAEHNGCQEARLEYGITDGPVYRDEQDTESVLLHLNVESFDRAKGWFQDDRFKDGGGALRRCRARHLHGEAEALTCPLGLTSPA